MPEIARREKVRVTDLLKLIEDLRSLKTRFHTLELQRLEEQHRIALESALKNLERRARGAGPEEIHRMQLEARRVVDADQERSREILALKYQKLDAGLSALQHLLEEMAPLQEKEDRLRTLEEGLRKAEEELNARRQALDREQAELERDRKLLQAAEEALGRKTQEVEAKLANLDIVRRARELDQIQEDLNGKIRAYQEQMALLTREREELNRDFEKQGEKKAEIEKEMETLQEERRRLQEEKRSLADTVAREMAATFEAYVRDLLRPSS